MGEQVKFVIYTKVPCKWGDEAQSLLTRLGHEFEVRDLSDPKHRALFDEKGFVTVPQIYVVTGQAGTGGFIGGYYDLRAWLESRS